MSSSSWRIAQVSTSDRGGGAEGSARNLFRAYRDRGHESWLVVGTKCTDDPAVYELPRVPRGPAGMRPVWWLSQYIRGRWGNRGIGRRLSRSLERLADPARLRDWWQGREEFQFPGGRELLSLLPQHPDIIHCHNLHGWYFDLASLPALSVRVPLIMNLRDAWLLTGHCGYPICCPRWEHGCGHCPDLARYPGIRTDATAANWVRKRRICAASRLYVSAPSAWLLDMARRVLPETIEFRLIPNGIDTGVFCPADRDAARRQLGLPEDRRIILFAAASGHNVYKDPDTMRRTLEAVLRDSRNRDVLVVSLGARLRRGARPAAGGMGRILEIPFQADAAAVAAYYRAADVFVHTARAEAFGKTVTEAMACGTPVVASAVGGICEQVTDGVTGRLLPVGDALGMAGAITELLQDDAARARLGAAAATRGREFSLSRQADAFLDWYGEILARRQTTGEAAEHP